MFTIKMHSNSFESHTYITYVRLICANVKKPQYIALLRATTHEYTRSTIVLYYKILASNFYKFKLNSIWSKEKINIIHVRMCCTQPTAHHQMRIFRNARNSYGGGKNTHAKISTITTAARLHRSAWHWSRFYNKMDV